MNFTSFHFVLFFFITLTLGHILKNRTQRIFLWIASYYFYGVFEPFYLVLILISTTWDYFSGIAIDSRIRRDEGAVLDGFRAWLSRFPRKTWVILSVVFNLCLLGYFKYTNFGIQVFNDLQPLGSTVFSWPTQYILLPVGISFYTFMSMSYTVDVYRGVVKARENFVDFALYICFFPHLVAGPIVRPNTFFSKLDNRLPVDREAVMIAVSRIVVGFFRKLVLADNIAPIVNEVFKNPAAYSTPDVWLAALCFGFQIYFDFAGYTDIARGVARLFGFEFEVNFNYPMATASIKDHWERWHLSLASWVRDYIFIPLGGSRGGSFRTYLNIFLSWAFVGIWHGAAYHFVVWGLWQAVMLSIHRAYSSTRVAIFLNEKGGMAYNVVARIVTMWALTFGFVWFRADQITIGNLLIGRMYGIPDIHVTWAAIKSWAFGQAAFSGIGSTLGGITVPSQFSQYWIIAVLYFVYEYFFAIYRLSTFRKPENRGKWIVLMIFMLFCIITLSSAESANFLYFQF
ncbi:MAG: MBOAT family protein [Spirochaetia bacterium]|nr:MBOAT family protein [Spirochaetia bacterium]